MKIADIVVPGDYENPYGQKVTIVKIEPRTERVYSGARWDMSGHTSTQKRAIASDGKTYLPREILRPWESAQMAIDKEAATASEIDGLVNEFKSLFPSDTRRRYSHYSSKFTNGIEITLSIGEMKELIARLAGDTDD